MSDNLVRVTVRILEKEYQVACPEQERAALIQSAELLSAKMQEIRATGKVVGLDRIAVMAALNLAHESIESGTEAKSLGSDLARRLRALNDRISLALGHDAQLSLPH